MKIPKPLPVIYVLKQAKPSPSKLGQFNIYIYIYVHKDRKNQITEIISKFFVWRDEIKIKFRHNLSFERHLHS